MKKKQMLSCFLAAAMVLSLTACGGGNKTTSDGGNAVSPAAGEPEKRLTIGWDSVTDRLDPIYISDQEGFTYAYMVYDCLVESDHKGGYEPALAEDWSVADDGMTWTFNLRKDVKFQNGQDFT